MKDLSVAVLIDGGFFIKRFRRIYSKSMQTPKDTADILYYLAHQHVAKEDYLYRIIYYDCEPFNKRIHNPISNKVVDFSNTPEANFRKEFFNELKKKRKVALRLGYLHESKKWVIRPRYTKDLLKGKVKIDELNEEDIVYPLTQKGIDIKIGVDITSMAIKGNVDRIILISGDSDFVPAAKMARREGIDFILDPMWNPIHDSLFEHIDGLKSTCPNPYRTRSKNKKK